MKAVIMFMILMVTTVMAAREPVTKTEELSSPIRGVNINLMMRNVEVDMSELVKCTPEGDRAMITKIGGGMYSVEFTKNAASLMDCSDASGNPTADERSQGDVQPKADQHCLIGGSFITEVPTVNGPEKRYNFVGYFKRDGKRDDTIDFQAVASFTETNVIFVTELGGVQATLSSGIGIAVSSTGMSVLVTVAAVTGLAIAVMMTMLVRAKKRLRSLQTEANLDSVQLSRIESSSSMA